MVSDRIVTQCAYIGLVGLVAAGTSACSESGSTMASAAVSPAVAAKAPTLIEQTQGRLGPLIPFHKDAIGASVLWQGTRPPRICFWMRPAEYRGSDLINPNASTGTTADAFKETFHTLVYGGFNFSRGTNGLDESNWSRVKADIGRENTLCVDLGHPDALKSPGTFDVSALTPEHFAQNAAAFYNAGSSRGLNYNIFCSGNTMLADGRLLTAGGHDKTGNSGIRKINIFDPATETWRSRAVPPVKTAYLADPAGTGPHPSALDEANIDPPDPSDMKYQRWYPTTVALPDGRVLILSGTDQDSAAGPANAAATKVRVAVPEVYDPTTDRTIALENARKLLPMYPRAHVVQTGPGKEDWQVAVLTEVEPPLPTGEALRGFDPFSYNGNTYLLDVRKALGDPRVATPDSRHWTFVHRAQVPHGEGGATAALWQLDANGLAMSQKVIVFGGDGGGGPTNVVEAIDYADATPRWKEQQSLGSAVTQNSAVALPDGNVLVLGGIRGRGPTAFVNYQFELFEPATGTFQPAVATTVPRHDHSTALLLPDATVIVMGGNRTDLVPGNRDAGVPVAQIYEPPYLFKGPRPVITAAPTTIHYRGKFNVDVSDAADVASVALVRIGPVTHNWDWDNRHVRLAFNPTGTGDRGGGNAGGQGQAVQRLHVSAPAFPGLAVPGYYMLFVINRAGVPSVAARVHLAPN